MSQYPYVGLRSFEREETDIFFGREDHTDELLNHLSQQHFLAVTGDSGCGKSSLVKTGLIPSLQAGFLSQAGTHWRIAEMHPGHQPFANLAQALIDRDALGEDYKTDLFQNDFLKRGSFSLHELLAIKPLPHHARLLIVCDQFEEIFRYDKKNIKLEAPAFVALLLASARPYLLPTSELVNNIYVIITMRSEYLGKCALFTGLTDTINAGSYLTPRLNREQLRLAIEEPALEFNGKVEPELAVKLLEDAENNQDQLPLLQHVLMRLWDLAADKSAPLTLDDYKKIGGLATALSCHAEEVYNKLITDERRLIAEMMFRILTMRDDAQKDTRRPTELSKIIELTGASPADVVDVIDAFRQPGCCFLMPPINKNAPLSDDSVIDISHESLIRQWETLQKWVKDEAESANTYRELKEASQKWVKGDRTLLQSEEFYYFSKWYRKTTITLLWAKKYDRNFELAQKFFLESEQRQRQNKELSECLLESHKRRISFYAQQENFKSDEEEVYQLAKFLFVSEVLDGVVNLANDLSPESYWLLEEMWLQNVKILRAYFLWDKSETKSRFCDHDKHFFKVTNDIRDKLVKKEIKALPSGFEEAKKYIQTRYLDENGKLREAKAGKVEELIEAEAFRIYKETDYSDEKKNWLLAETYIKQYCSGKGNKFWAFEKDVFDKRRDKLIEEQAYYIYKITGYTDNEKNRKLAEIYVDEVYKNKPLGDDSLKLSWLIREKARRIHETTGSTNMTHNWILAETYIRMFYENIIPAVEENDKEKVLQILKAFQYSKTSGFLIKSCFEVALAIYFLSPDIIQALWDESKGEDRPESNVESVVFVNSWPQNFTVDEPIKARFWPSENHNEIRFKGVMLEVERDALLKALDSATSGNPAQEHIDAIEALYKQSRLIHKDTTL
jgi:energy-coupling factor transporter ATP-binding protein EcfA2